MSRKDVLGHITPAIIPVPVLPRPDHLSTSFPDLFSEPDPYPVPTDCVNLQSAARVQQLLIPISVS